MSKRLYATLFLATALAACVAADEAADDTGAGGKADGQTALLKFDASWNETKTGTLMAGGEVRINYALDRLTDCRGEAMGSEVWGVTGYASFNGAAPVTFGVSRIDSSGKVVPVVATVSIPASATSVELWFSVSNRWGCIAYDSNEGANYGFGVERAASGAVLSFDADWSESQSDAVHAGDSVVVHYDPARLARCAGSTSGHAAWSVTGYYQVDGGSVKSVMVTRADGSTLVPADPTFVVPRGGDLAMWFEATNVWGCHEYDSSSGANYHFAIE